MRTIDDQREAITTLRSEVSEGFKDIQELLQLVIMSGKNSRRKGKGC